MMISIVYVRGYGHTTSQAEAVADGARDVSGNQVPPIAVADGPIALESLESSDAP
jgi:hypothetical protein